MFRYVRPVRFSEVDAAQIVFFARYLDFCHDAIEALFAGLPGGYAHLTMVRDVGVPSVRVEIDYRAPLRYGDVALIDVTVEAIGTKSVTLRHDFTREADGVSVATIRQVVVTSHLRDLRGIAVPDDLRRLLSEHLPGA